MAIRIESALSVTESGPLSAAPHAAGMTVGYLTRALERMFPPQDAEAWDRTGLLVGDPSAEVVGVATALDPTPSAVERAQAAGANVLLTHHPVFLDPPEKIGPMGSGVPVSGAAVYEAARRGIALVNFHTALDSSAQARAMLPGLLRLNVAGVLEPLPRDQERGYGQVCTFPEGRGAVSLELLAARCTAVFGRAPRVWGDMNRALSTAVTWTGSASGAATGCLARGIDVLVCGEIKYHEALEASESGLAIVELGHDVSELPFAAVLAEAAAGVGVARERIKCLDQSSNWTHPEATRA